MIMRTVAALLISTAVGAGAIGAAVKLNQPLQAFISEHDWERNRPGPDSGRVAILIDALAHTDPVVCELIGDQLGNFWWSGAESGVGRLAASTTTLQAAKDSIGGTITDERAISRLIAELDGSNACTRRVASKLLGRSTISGARLASLLNDPSANVRESAALAAGNGEHKDTRAALVRALDDKSSAVVAMAAWALGEIEDKASVPPLVKLVRAGDTRVRLASIWALGQIEDARAVPDIIVTLQDPNAAVRALSAEVLGSLEKPEAIKPLEGALARDTEPKVRVEAASSLGKISSSSSGAALGRALSDPDVEVRRAAAEALGDLDELHVAPAGLVSALSSSDTELRYRAAQALAEIADPATTSALVGLVSSGDAELRKHAIEALGNIGSPTAIQAITKALTDSDAEVRKAAAEALGEIKDSSGE
jgi:HEAT repeat protein